MQNNGVFGACDDEALRMIALRDDLEDAVLELVVVDLSVVD